MSDPAKYRSRDEVEYHKKTDPIIIVKHQILDRGIASDMELKSIESKVKDQIKEAAEFAEQSQFPDKKELHTDVLASQY